MFQKSYEWVRSLEPTHGANGSSATVLSGGRYWLLGWRRSWLLFFLLFRQRAGPGRAQQREQIAVNAIVARDAPGQNQQNRQEAQDRVGADGPRQQIVEVHHQRSEEHTSELQSQSNLVCRLLLEKKTTSITSSGPKITRLINASNKRHNSKPSKTLQHTCGTNGMRTRDASKTHLFFFNDTATTEIYTLSLHDALPISLPSVRASMAASASSTVGSDGVLRR